MTDNAVGYEVSPEGVYASVNRGFIRSVLKVKGDPTTPIIDEFAEWAGPKIPFRVVKQMLEFFDEVHEEHGTEACAYIMCDDRTKEYSLFIPPQWVQTAHCCHHPELSEGWERLSATSTMALFTHLHPPRLGFPTHSGEDEAMERSTSPIVSMVVSGFDLECWNPSITIAVEARLFRSIKSGTIFDMEDDQVDVDWGVPEWDHLVSAEMCPTCREKPPIQNLFQRFTGELQSVHDYTPYLSYQHQAAEVDEGDINDDVDNLRESVLALADLLVQNNASDFVKFPEWCDPEKFKYLVDLLTGTTVLREVVMDELGQPKFSLEPVGRAGPPDLTYTQELQDFDVDFQKEAHRCELQEPLLSEQEEPPPTSGTH